ncbi:sensor histidine kinase [Streptomyces sp. CMB-StM0423]|uniref:sensor histidine kinase n=1 Tax=Streptomyces sp. CMB-StM0423 TaxID=2059884 RepID=UPI000C6FDF2F|nr:histidine kinase [Streptomyces sp. CMB-StM0423]AUH43807.1 two-component sensor histidine kinase [Streptomyces sp. CMB-StM0423]
MAKRVAAWPGTALRVLRADLWTTAVSPPPSTAPAVAAERSRLREWLPALFVPVVLGLVALQIAATNQYAFGYGMGMRVSALLTALQTAAFLIALVRPVLAWWIMTAAMVAVARYALASSGSESGVMFPWTGTGLVLQATVLFAVALRCRPRVAVETLVVSVLVGLGYGFLGDTEGVPFAVLVLTLPVGVGVALRGRRVARTELAAQEELTAEERARRVLLQERTRIARELHDVVAHHMSVISIQAQVAPHLVRDPPAELKENLAGIRASAVEALTELRRVLGVLRADDPSPEAAAPHPHDVRHAPQPTLDRLGELAAAVRRAGVDTETRTTGEPYALPPGVELSAYRIVQEALSNVARHAPGARALAEIGYHPAGLTVRVTNTAPERAAPPWAGAGHGLLGMRERAAMLGGELATGTTPDGGYEVTAILPVARAAPAAPAVPATPEDTP